MASYTIWRDFVSSEYALVAYPGFSVDSNRAFRFNTGPQAIDSYTFTKLTYAYEMSLNETLPSVYDLEGDPLTISIRDKSNPFWILHATYQGVNKNGTFLYFMVSNPITEQYVKLGHSTINVVLLEAFR